MKLCKDCSNRMFAGVWGNLCKSDNFPKNPIHGGAELKCETARTDDSMCGIEAKWFEQKVSWFKLTFGV